MRIFKPIVFLNIILLSVFLLHGCSGDTGAEAGTQGADGSMTTAAGDTTGKVKEASGNTGEVSNKVDITAGAGEASSESGAQGTKAAADESKDRSVYQLKEPDFIRLDNISFCKVAQDYISLTDEEFDKKYSADELWKYGAFDRLLFTGNTKGRIIADIGIGSPLQKVVDIFGECGFGTKDTYHPKDASYKNYLLYGYKTRDFYFAFQIDPVTRLVQSVCFRKRYVVPEDRKDILAVLAKYDDWYSTIYSEEKTAEWGKYFENDRVTFAQWSRGSMTMICDYGFTSSAGMGVFYEVYQDFSGIVPILPKRQSELGEGDYESITVKEMDYPEWMIYRIYNYLAEQASALEWKHGRMSPDGGVFTYNVDDGDWLDMRLTSGLYETAHVVFHWQDASKPDRHVYFGHYSTIVGYIGNRYFVESDMMGLHVLDLQSWKIVYKEEDTVDGRSDLRIDEKKSGIYAEDGSLRYSYKLDEDGNITVRKVAE